MSLIRKSLNPLEVVWVLSRGDPSSSEEQLSPESPVCVYMYMCTFFLFAYHALYCMYMYVCIILHVSSMNSVCVCVCACVCVSHGTAGYIGFHWTVPPVPWYSGTRRTVGYGRVQWDTQASTGLSYPPDIHVRLYCGMVECPYTSQGRVWLG